MRIKDIGGEFALIDRLFKIVPAAHPGLLAGIGDDAAVIRSPGAGDTYLLVTTDALVAGEHFNAAWARPDQIGMKAVECNVSDIAAMGGEPTFMFITLVLAPETAVEWVEALYAGMARACKEHGVVAAGGDTTHGAVTTVSITLLGSVAGPNLCLRSHARPGDVLAVTGTLGASSAGLRLMQNGLPVSAYLQAKHLTPHSRLDASRQLAPLVNAMIDVSDGLASEVNHICRQSQVGARVTARDIPLHPEVIEAARVLGVPPEDFALNGGEDFELLFSIAPERLAVLRLTGLAFYPVGEITDGEPGAVLIIPDNQKLPLKGGYDHFE